MKSKLSPIEELRLAKAELINECAKEKDQLFDNLEYAKSNLGRLFLNSLFPSKRSSFTKKKNKTSNKSNDNSPFNNFRETIMASTPLLWELAQPLLIGFVIKKFKSVFSKKKK